MFKKKKNAGKFDLNHNLMNVETEMSKNQLFYNKNVVCSFFQI